MIATRPFWAVEKRISLSSSPFVMAMIAVRCFGIYERVDMYNYVGIIIQHVFNGRSVWGKTEARVISKRKTVRTTTYGL